jgi:hypothetical protein
MIHHSFTDKIINILSNNFPKEGEEILKTSPIIQYLNIKTKAANKGSKSRSSFANHYALYVLVEDYINNGFVDNKNYKEYEGAIFSKLFKRQRELPFGSKLQNHALNHRFNEEFKKLFPTLNMTPVIRDANTNRYWINEKLLLNDSKNLSETIIEIIDEYVMARQQSFNEFIDSCKKISLMKNDSLDEVIEFIKSLLDKNVDARIFEIVSFSILKYHYSDKKIYWGWSPEKLIEESLMLYKTGRTNANDGGIDFVMKPLGRFFQVTETVDLGKYFLDIDKVQRYPLTFVVKSDESQDSILKMMKLKAEERYQIKAVVNSYINAIEEVINIPTLLEILEDVVISGYIKNVIDEIILQSKLEFNIVDSE